MSTGLFCSAQAISQTCFISRKVRADLQDSQSVPANSRLVKDALKSRPNKFNSLGGF